ncbi:hypothetical protein ACWE42_10745 [Sutcliffiella cohnii]
MRTILFLLVTSLLLAGCGIDGERISQSEDIDGTKFINNRYGGYYERDLDSERYNTNQNPNFIDLTENRPTYGDDQDKAREVINAVSGVRAGSIFINGNTIHATVYTTEKKDKKERDELKKKVNRKLARALPRYDYDVQLQNEN